MSKEKRKKKDSIRKMLQMAYESGALCYTLPGKSQSSMNELNKLKRRTGLTTDEVRGFNTNLGYQVHFLARIREAERKRILNIEMYTR